MKIIELFNKKAKEKEGCKRSRVGPTLVIDCRDCDGACDLESIECLNSAIRLLAQEEGVESIHLKGEMDTLYGREAIASLIELAEVSRICLGHIREVNGKECTDCPCHPQAVFEPIANAMASPSMHRVRERVLSFPSRGEECKACCQRTLASLRDVEGQLSAIAERVNLEAFHVVEGSDA
jgi:hypothetical protein